MYLCVKKKSILYELKNKTKQNKKQTKNQKKKKERKLKKLIWHVFIKCLLLLNSKFIRYSSKKGPLLERERERERERCFVLKKKVIVPWW